MTAEHRSLATIWELPDPLWHEVEAILLEDAPLRPTGRPRVSLRQVFDAIIFRMRNGCQWTKLPERFGAPSTLHRWFQRWCEHGVMERIWGRLVERADELGLVQWRWQSADGAMSKARFPGDQVGANPTDRGKPGTKRSVLVEADGEPLSVVIAGANVHDSKLLAATIESVVVERPDPDEVEQNLCLDKAYDSKSARAITERQGYEPHIRRIGEEKRGCRRGKPASLGSGAHDQLAVEVPSYFGALRQARRQLPRFASTCLRPALVQAPGALTGPRQTRHVASL